MANQKAKGKYQKAKIFSKAFLLFVGSANLFTFHF